jgi:Leucine-rich repeat (LRR) protein
MKQKLTQLKLDGNRLAEFPVETLSRLSQLEILDLSNNQLTEMVHLPFHYFLSRARLNPPSCHHVVLVPR